MGKSVGSLAQLHPGKALMTSISISYLRKKDEDRQVNERETQCP
jgi:hypothetical protein